MHVQSVQKYCFSLSNMQICGGFCCRRRRGCLSSLMKKRIFKLGRYFISLFYRRLRRRGKYGLDEDTTSQAGEGHYENMNWDNDLGPLPPVPDEPPSGGAPAPPPPPPPPPYGGGN